MLKYCCLGVPCLLNVIIIFMMSSWPQLFSVKSIIFLIDLTRFICRNISNIFGHAQIWTNECFVPNSSSVKGDSFHASFISSKDNRWSRASMVSLFSWCVLGRFKLYFWYFSIYATLFNAWTVWVNDRIIFCYSRYIDFRCWRSVYLFIFMLVTDSSFVRDHALILILTMVNTSLVRSTFNIIFLPARTFLGSSGKADAPPVCLLPRLARSASYHYCFFNKVYLNTFDVWFHWLLSRIQSAHSLEGFALFLRVLWSFWCLQNSWRDCLFLRVFSIFWCFRRFRRGFRIGEGFFAGFSFTGNFRAIC